ncbi:glucosaminidase domain-containing protein [Exilibacterium tricleocarpae]|nr:glucosaminidase domain-containing protein [Exilibacterium tricleocarpae]
MTESQPTSTKYQFVAFCILGYTFATLALIYVVIEHRLRPPPIEPPTVVVTPDFAAIESVSERKAAFFDYLNPLIAEQNQLLQQQRLALVKIQHSLLNDQPLTAPQLLQFAELRRQFVIDEELSKEDALQELLLRVDQLPAAMVLAQAAMESAWGTSRFARLANNYFGQWCFNTGCGLVPAHRPAGARHEVRRFESVTEAVAAYFHNINTHRAYIELRSLRALRRRAKQPLEGPVLVAGLEKYSTKGSAYIEELRAIIRVNDLTQYN